MRHFLCLLILIFVAEATAQPGRLERYNLASFTGREKIESAELRKFVGEKFQAHPEFGISPFDGPPCDDCIEVIDRRDADSRYFIRNDGQGSEFFQMKSSIPINFLDKNGWWREINHRLQKNSEKIFTAENQPVPIIIDMEKHHFSMTNDLYRLASEFPELFLEDESGRHSLGKRNFNNYTAGDDGVYLRNVYPGIDMAITVRRGEVETYYVINSRPSWFSGQLVLSQRFELPAGLQLSAEKDYPHPQDIHLTSKSGDIFFTIEEGYAFDASGGASKRLHSSVAANDAVEFYIPVQWLQDQATQYPVLIDPLITTFNSLPVPSIAGTRFSPVCWTNSCDYFMTVPTPGNTTLLGVYHSFEYYATGPCYADDGGYSIDLLTCTAPSAAPGVYTNTAHTMNTYFTVDTVLIPEFNACLPAPQCAAQNLNFTLHFYRCNNDPDLTCAANCIRATRPWIMYIRGRTVEVSFISPALMACEGSSFGLVVAAQNGVGPYSYSWSPTGGTNDTLIVLPTSSTIYTATITDACGVTASSTASVTVIPDNNPGFTVSPNPSCINTPITLSGNAGGAANDYDWDVPGSNAPGGQIFNTQAPVVTYPAAGTYPAILNFRNGSCTFRDTVQVNITAAGSAAVSINTQPSGTVCPGDTIRFYASPVNGGASPTFDWFLDGILVQSGSSDSLVTSSFANGSVVEVILHSNASCVSPLVDSAAISLSVGATTAPQVTISPDTAACSGSAVTLNATVSNGGSSPSYQWYVNGNPVLNATNSSYTHIVVSPDTIVGVSVTSSLACAPTPMASDSSYIILLNNAQAAVNISAFPAGTVCAGDNVQYNASSVYGGSLPSFQWYVNGIPTGINDSVFTHTPNNGDSVSVELTSSIACLASGIDNDFVIATVSPAVSPSVGISAASFNICQGDTITFTANTLNAGSNPSYAWTVNGIPIGINDSVFTGHSFSDNDVVAVTVTSSLSCAPIATDNDLVTIDVAGNVAPSLSISAMASGICSNDPVQFIATPGNGGAGPAYQWFVNGVSTGLINDTIILTNLNPGDTVVAMMTSSLSCLSQPTASSPAFISSQLPYVSPQISIRSVPGDSICIGQPVTLLSDLQHGGSSPVINWYVSGTNNGITSTSFTSSDLVQGDVVVANMTSNAPCLVQPYDTSNFIRIYYHPPLDIQISTDTVACPGVPIMVTALATGGNRGPYSINWSDGQTGDTITVIPGRSTLLSVTLEDHCTVLSAIDTLLVPVLSGPLADFTYANPAPGSFEHNIQFQNLSEDADNWVWIFPDSTTSTVLHPVHNFGEEGDYDVMLITYNNSGCVDSILYRVSVKEEIAIFYPGSFSPNGDGLNDYFRPVGASLDEYIMTIYNRWGEVIFSGNSMKPWDGSTGNSSDPAQEGVYIFRIEHIGNQYDKKVVTGRVTLIR